MTKVSVKGAARDAMRADERMRKALVSKSGSPALSAGRHATVDSFINFQAKLGIGADNPLSTATYGFNPISRNRNLLEWIHRGTWLGGVAIDVKADDMTRAGVDIIGELAPEDSDRLQRGLRGIGMWPAINETIRWGRLYGGAICVALVDGQDMRTPLRLETIGPGQFKGLLTLDRWMVEPSLQDLVTDLGPKLGLPKYYKVQANAPALRHTTIHHSRVMVRHIGVDLPYQQRLIENLWGMSVLERLYDRMIAFDSASTGMAQLIYKSYLRTMKVDGLREIVAAGGKMLDGLTAYVDMMRRFQSMEGITLIDAKDEVEVQQHQAMSGMADALDRFGQQVAGALRTPLTRLLGTSGGGLNGTNDADIQLYYDSVNQDQDKDIGPGVTAIHRLQAASDGIMLPPDFAVEFCSLWEMSDEEKATTANTVTDAVTKAVDAGAFGTKTLLKELRQSARKTGIFTNITEAMIEAATDDVGPPPGMEGGIDPATGLPLPSVDPLNPNPADPTAPPGADPNEEAPTGPEGQAQAVDPGARRRAVLQRKAPVGGSPGVGDHQGDGT